MELADLEGEVGGGSVCVLSALSFFGETHLFQLGVLLQKALNVS